MPFDPTKPAFGSPDSSAEMRDQLNALKALIDAQAAQIASLSAQLADVPNQIAAAIAGTSSNSDGVANLGLTIANNPPQQYEVQPIADKLDELINALKR
jgi:dihydroxyacetone kinase